MIQAIIHHRDGVQHGRVQPSNNDVWLFDIFPEPGDVPLNLAAYQEFSAILETEGLRYSVIAHQCGAAGSHLHFKLSPDEDKLLAKSPSVSPDLA